MNKQEKQELMRLQVFLSHNDSCSRRAAMDMIQKGLVSVNEEIVTEPSFQVDPDVDKVFIEDRRIKQKKMEYLMLHKPTGYVTTKSDPHASKTIYDLIPAKYSHLSPVGRLDKDTEGLLLLTNDGEAANHLTHPRYNVNKVYFVRVRHRMEMEQRLKVERGVYLDGKKTSPSKIRILKVKKDFTECHITLHEGRKRQVRRMFAKVKHKVTFLKRIVQGPLVLGSLRIGTWRPLTEKEIEKLKAI